MTEPRKLRVFLCHASQDKEVVCFYYYISLGTHNEYHLTTQ